MLLTWWAWGCGPGGTGTYWVCVLLTGCVRYLLGGRGAVHLGVKVLTGCVCVTYWVCVLLTGCVCYLLGGCVLLTVGVYVTYLVGVGLWTWG